MRIQLVGHATVILWCSDATILTDPWLGGTAFNDSWRLYPEPFWQPGFFDSITHIWISHEHPDHFHIPTLKSLPADFKKRVTLLYQKNNSRKMFDAFRKLGFQTFVELPNRAKVSISPETTVYCHQIGQMDSMLGVLNGGETLLNINDAEAKDDDCRRTVRDLGKIDVVLNQFSLAGYGGATDFDVQLPRVSGEILRTMAANHRALGAEVTIPIASFVYFCATDNAYINRFANTPIDVWDHFAAEKLRCEILYPGDTFDLKAGFDSGSALEKFRKLHDNPELEYFTPPLVTAEKIADSFRARALEWSSRYPKWIVRWLKPLTVHAPDLKQSFRLDPSKALCEPVAGTAKDADLVVYSQPLHFAFAFPFGIQTLGVSARLIVVRNEEIWKRYRILSSLSNAEIFLKPRYLFTWRNAVYLKGRLPGALGQIRYRLEGM